MPAQLVQIFVLGAIGFGACLFFGLRTKNSYRWMLLAMGSFGLVATIFFLVMAMSGGVRQG